MVKGHCVRVILVEPKFAFRVVRASDTTLVQASSTTPCSFELLPRFMWNQSRRVPHGVTTRLRPANPGICEHMLDTGDSTAGACQPCTAVVCDFHPLPAAVVLDQVASLYRPDRIPSPICNTPRFSVRCTTVPRNNYAPLVVLDRFPANS